MGGTITEGKISDGSFYLPTLTLFSIFWTKPSLSERNVIGSTSSKQPITSQDEQANQSRPQQTTTGTLIIHVLQVRYVAVWTGGSDAPTETKTNNNNKKTHFKKTTTIFSLGRGECFHKKSKCYFCTIYHLELL